MGLGHRSPENTLKSMKRQDKISLSKTSLRKTKSKLNHIHENISMSRSRQNYGSRHSSNSRHSRELKFLQKRRKNLNGPVQTVEQLQARLDALRGIHGPVQTVEQLQARLDALRGIHGPVQTLEELEKRLKKLENKVENI